MLVTNISLIAQNKNSVIILKYSFNAVNTLINKDKITTQKELFFKDVAIGLAGKIYISDAISKKIISFKKNGEYDSEINLDIDLDNTQFDMIKISIDVKDNLYVLLLNGEFYIKLVKYFNGKIINNFNLENPLPFDRNTALLVSNDKIFIRTTSSAPDPRYAEDGEVFVYNTNGQFLGRTDYAYEDLNGFVYKRKPNKEKYYIEIFRATENILMTRDLKKIDDIVIPYSQPGRKTNKDWWSIVGIDQQNNIYFFNGYKVLKYNPKLNTKMESIFNIKRIEDKSISIKYPANVKVDFDGKLYVLGSTGSLKDNFLDSKVIILQND